MFELTAYFDESEDSEVFSMAAVLGDVERWGELENTWTALLQQEGLSEYHAADCHHGKREFHAKRWVERAVARSRSLPKRHHRLAFGKCVHWRR